MTGSPARIPFWEGNPHHSDDDIELGADAAIFGFVPCGGPIILDFDEPTPEPILMPPAPSERADRYPGYAADLGEIWIFGPSLWERLRDRFFRWRWL